MRPLTLPEPAGYQPGVSPVVGATAAQLDALLATLAARVGDMPPEQLEWQLRPGVNTIGMLLAHLAVAEVYWVSMAAGGGSDEEAGQTVESILGIRMEDDGMPLPANAAPPASLAGRTAAGYLELLRRARAETHRVLRRLDDRELAEIRTVDGRGISLGWVLYHLVEHFAYHLGQISQLAALRRHQCG
jgi:uncharacterized damage-inducible protein DinB